MARNAGERRDAPDEGEFARPACLLSQVISVFERAIGELDHFGNGVSLTLEVGDTAGAPRSA
jgi:hypothetical protein